MEASKSDQFSKPVFGTKEWAGTSENCLIGCRNGCKYFYALESNVRHTLCNLGENVYFGVNPRVGKKGGRTTSNTWVYSIPRLIMGRRGMPIPHPEQILPVDSLPVFEKIKKLILNGNDGTYHSRSEANMAVITALVNFLGKGPDF